mgnify:CR=1 FL=1
MPRVANALSIATAVSLALLAGASPVQPAQAAVETDCGIEMPCRIETGEYGYCEETGEPIGVRRLDARPIATLSLEAQERHEREEKVYRDD